MCGYRLGLLASSARLNDVNVSPSRSFRNTIVAAYNRSMDAYSSKATRLRRGGGG